MNVLRPGADLARHKFTVRDIEQMSEIGVLRAEDRVELIEGELIEMPAKGNRHEILKTLLNIHFARTLPENVLFTQETTFRLSKRTYVEPDFLFYPADLPLADIAGHNVLLAIEIGHSSLGYDLGLKAKVYAAHGLRELWVIDAVKLETHVHRSPKGAKGANFEEIRAAEAAESLTPDLISGISMTLARLDVGD